MKELEKDFAKERIIGGKKMTIQKALSLSSEEFEMLDNEYGGFNKETYSNHKLSGDDETSLGFLREGSEKIKNNPVVKGNLI